MDAVYSEDKTSIKCTRERDSGKFHFKVRSSIQPPRAYFGKRLVGGLGSNQPAEERQEKFGVQFEYNPS
jgi:hypothetical protein